MLLLGKLITLFMLASLSAKFTEQKSERIYGGVLTSILNYPFLVSLKKLDKTHFCGGSIINIDTILTAAHCAQVPFQKLVADCETNEDDYGYVRTVQWIKVHEEYHRINDIAIIKVNEEFVFGPGVGKIQLNDAKLIPPGTKAVVVGWGISKEETESTPSSQTYPLPVAVTQTIAHAKCRTFFWGPLTDSDICVQDADRGSCQGDSGGPLIIDNLLVGITSTGHRCVNLINYNV